MKKKNTNLALPQQGMYLSAFDNAMVFDIAWNLSTLINRPMNLQVLVDNVQIIPFTLQCNSRGSKG